MDTNPDRKISRFQTSLSTLRKVAGWSAEELGNKLDLTRQSIMNLETGQTKMSKIQYIAFRAVFMDEILEGKNEALGRLLETMVDNDETTDEDRGRLKGAVDDAVSSVGRRTGSKAAGLVAAGAAIAALGAMTTGPLGTLAMIAASKWLAEMIHKE